MERRWRAIRDSRSRITARKGARLHPGYGSQSLNETRRRDRMTSTQILSDFAAALASGAIEVVDLTAPLGPETPLIKLPPEIGKNTPPIEVHAISDYDKDGP